MNCDFCGNKEVKVRRITRTYGKGNNMFVIENIPVVSCPSCGESYLTAETLHEVERLKMHRKDIAKERSLKVVSYS